MIVAPARTFVPAARRDGPRWLLAAAVAVALGVHAALAFAIRLQAPATATPRVIELNLTTAEALFGRPAATVETVPSTADAASSRIVPRTGKAPVVEQTVAGKPQATLAASPSVRRSEVSPSPIAADPPRPLAGKSVADLVAAVAGAASHESANRPSARITRLGDGAPGRADFAYYLDSWRRKIERIGELNYPREARAKGITGSLRLLVSIAPDGALRGAKVLETSGQRLLDDAALRIVHLAAPYAPFSPAMRASTDLLEIERVWQFRNSRLAP